MTPNSHFSCCLCPRRTSVFLLSRTRGRPSRLPGLQVLEPRDPQEKAAERVRRQSSGSHQKECLESWHPSSQALRPVSGYAGPSIWSAVATRPNLEKNALADCTFVWNPGVRKVIPWSTIADRQTTEFHGASPMPRRNALRATGFTNFSSLKFLAARGG